MNTIERFPADLTEGQAKPWVPHFLMLRETPACRSMSVHVSGLLPGHCPHAPHVHEEEEILIMLAGEAELVVADGPSAEGARIETVRPGDGIYYPPTQHHTIRNASDAPITYLMLKWVARQDGEGKGPAGAVRFTYSDRRDSTGFTPIVAFDAPSTRLKRLHTHLTLLAPGAGYGAHADPYDVAIVLLDGEVETLGERVAAPALIFHDQGEPHGVRNVGSEVARYAVFELEAA